MQLFKIKFMKQISTFWKVKNIPQMIVLLFCIIYAIYVESMSL